ncbi:protein kinase domain-containing protein [Allorhodopirellula solitaria]|uniref:Alkyl hydroperoxide reductase C n=1 Tax=Allorhodopirellula solitaria TaxID=2527987 RepID=A0A5C5WLX6_9BACT|nr:protein kinase [Allorhodopirellula solitaria]TWT51668.1 Alkyl hydroperoxide reductase subunit C [Allorhodopirellula solitaria]
MNGTSLIGQPAPEFELPCITSSGRLYTTTIARFRGKWLTLIFYPQDFSLICPTELTAFSARLPEFQQRECELLGISSDSIDRHRDWLATPPSEGGLGPIQFPLGADERGSVAQAYGTWQREKGLSARGLFIVSPNGVVEYGVVHNLSVGRSVDEVLRVLDALRSGGLCPVSWTKADGTIDVEELLQPGRLIGHYRVAETLGKGNFGTVVAAHDERLDREVAVKVLRTNALESRANLLDEARAAAKLQHPNICTVFAIEEEDGLPLIAMERIDGRCLSHLIDEGLTTLQQNSIARGIAAGLTAAHAQSITHGDLKPANILVKEDGTPKILDFGLARGNRAQSEKSRRQPSDASAGVKNVVMPAADPHVVDPHGASAMSLDNDDSSGGQFAVTTSLDRPTLSDTSDDTHSDVSRRSVIRGTPLYMSPEQIRGEPTTPASDVFSFGLVWYELMTGDRALPNSLAEIYNALQSDEFADEISVHVPSEWQSRLHTLLAKDPRERPTIQQFLAQI